VKFVGKWVCSHTSIAFWRWWQLISVESNFRHFSKQFCYFWLANCGQKRAVLGLVRTQVIAISIINPQSSSASFHHIFLTANLWVHVPWSVVLVLIWYITLVLVLVLVSPATWYIVLLRDHQLRRSRAIKLLILVLQFELYIILGCCFRIALSILSQRVLILMKSVLFLQQRQKVLDVYKCLRRRYIQDLDQPFSFF
jgi:hypothetical protein